MTTTTTPTRKNAIRYINDTEVQVTKAFIQRATIFGTEEFNLWREYKVVFPKAQMTTKTIKKSDKQKKRRNKTYDNMKAFINSLAVEEAKKAMAEFETVKKRSKVQTSPYQYVLDWFENRFKGYDTLDGFMSQKEAERKEKEDAEKASSSPAENNA